MRNNKGFTLIELIMVILILGILAAAAIPKYQNLRGDAEQAAANGVYGSLQAATSINFAARLFSPSKTRISSITTLLSALEENTTPNGWQITGNSLVMINNTGYAIGVSTAELPATAGSPPSSKAILRKSW